MQIDKDEEEMERSQGKTRLLIVKIIGIAQLASDRNDSKRGE